MLLTTRNRTQTPRVCKRNPAKGNVLQTSVNFLQHKRLRRLVLRTFAALSLSGITLGFGLTSGWHLEENRLHFESDRAIAQQVDPQLRANFLSDPLTGEPRDPLLPATTTPRPLRPLELRALRENLAELNQQAEAQLANGQIDEAFALLMREIRLRRVFGSVAEFNAIAPVAELAWEQQRAVEVQLLTLRMREILAAVQADLSGVEAATEEEAVEEEVSTPLPAVTAASEQSDIEVLVEIARIFIDLRDVESTVAVYEQIIDLAIAQGFDPAPAQRELAAYHLSWFQFAQATDVYRTLLGEAREAGEQSLEIEYLEQLVYGYQQANSLANAARAQTDLVSLYQATGQEEALPELLLAIAQNYRTLNWTEDAIAYYRSAYSAAQRFEQFSVSAQVLRDLGELYQAIALFDEALVAYNLLVPVEQQAYNEYGIMNAYDNIGQIERRRGNLAESLQAFQRALTIANRLSLDEDYFIEQIESVTQLDTIQ